MYYILIMEQWGTKWTILGTDNDLHRAKRLATSASKYYRAIVTDGVDKAAREGAGYGAAIADSRRGDLYEVPVDTD